MASPQCENGHTEIANELLEAIIRTPLSDYEHRVFWLIIRKTYGYKKKQDWISQTQIVAGTGINKQNVCRTIKKLIIKNMITKDKKQLSIQKDYDEWKLSKQITNIIGSNLKRLPKKLSIEITKVIHIDNESNLNRVPQKKYIQNSIYISILDYWNNKNIIITSMTENLAKQMKIAHKTYTKEQILLAMDNYATALKDNDYFYDNVWSLLKFLKQGNALPEWLSDGSYWISYQNRKSKPKQLNLTGEHEIKYKEYIPGETIR